MKHTVSNVKKIVAACAASLGLTGLALLGAAGHAVAAPVDYTDNGSHDEMVEVHGGSHTVTFIMDDDGVFADDVRGATLWTPGAVS